MLRIVARRHDHVGVTHKVSYIFTVHGQPVPQPRNPATSNRGAIENTNSNGIAA
jgi:hypothetical protein